MRCVPFIAHIHNRLEGGFPSIDTSMLIVHAVIECMFEVLKKKNPAGIKGALATFYTYCKSNCWVFLIYI